ncbi:MAG: histidine phosphatase family protein [Candidatus Rokubacteria bacterium]|nr:histidine phosphatase family protein [Candidatus Rokubacteria bacterium]
MTLRLLLVRHAQTPWNVERRFQGWRDTPLSEAGLRQAAAVGRALAETPIHAIYASPLERARATAEAIGAARGLPVHLHEAFKEVGYGEWEGLTGDEVRARAPEAFQAWLAAPQSIVPPGGEPLVEVQRRVLAGLADLRARHDGQTVCVVAHAITGRILILEVLGLPLERLWSVHLAATGISELEFRDDWSALHRMNTLVHLDGLPA